MAFGCPFRIVARGRGRAALTAALVMALACSPRPPRPPDARPPVEPLGDTAPTPGTEAPPTADVGPDAADDTASNDAAPAPGSQGVADAADGPTQARPGSFVCGGAAGTPCPEGLWCVDAQDEGRNRPGDGGVCRPRGGLGAPCLDEEPGGEACSDGLICLRGTAGESFCRMLPMPVTAADEAFLDLAPQAGAAFLGRLVEAGPAPAMWCGRLMTTQWLRYEVLRSLRGHVQGPELQVFALMVGNEAYVRSDVPGLRDEFLVVGREYLVLLGDALPGIGPKVLGLVRSTPALLDRLDEQLGAAP
jgi:hypothetical protein